MIRNPTTGDLLMLTGLALIVGALLGWWFLPTNVITTTNSVPTPYPIKVTVTKHDTTFITKWRPRTVYVDVPSDTTIIRAGDTIATPPFTDRLDTFGLDGDTIGLAYHFPERTFDLMHLPRRDSTPVIRTVETITLMQSRPWYETVGLVGAGAIIGGVLDHFLVKR